MKTMYRLFAIFLTSLIIMQSSLCLVTPRISCADDGRITYFPPETIEAQPEITTKTDEQGTSTWWWYVLGAAIIGGVLAAAESGKGGQSGSGNGGTIVTTW